jgi:cation diffusion facilitator CzcD-associated flavoprotein CzcO
VKTADGVEHELDVLVFATGFDAVDGNYRRMDMRGRGGMTVDQHWKEAPTSYLGVATAGFPNVFMILGPNGPFTNLVPSIEAQVEFITKMVAEAERRDSVVEVTQAAEDAWTDTCKTIADFTLFPKTDSWIFGANIPEKKNSVLFYLGGLAAYRGILEDVESKEFEGFAFREPVTAG